MTNVQLYASKMIKSTKKDTKTGSSASIVKTIDARIVSYAFFTNVLCLFTKSGTVGLEIGVGRMVVIMIVRQTVLIKIG